MSINLAGYVLLSKSHNRLDFQVGRAPSPDIMITSDSNS